MTGACPLYKMFNNDFAHKVSKAEGKTKLKPVFLHSGTTKNGMQIAHHTKPAFPSLEDATIILVKAGLCILLILYRTLLSTV